MDVDSEKMFLVSLGNSIQQRIMMIMRVQWQWVTW